MGRITGILDGRRNLTGDNTDSWSWVCGLQHSDEGKEGCTYDHVGHVTSTTDANGGIITYHYNSQGKVCEMIDQEGCSKTFRYDREGRMVLHVDRNRNSVKTTLSLDVYTRRFFYGSSKIYA